MYTLNFLYVIEVRDFSMCESALYMHVFTFSLTTICHAKKDYKYRLQDPIEVMFEVN